MHRTHLNDVLRDAEIAVAIRPAVGRHQFSRRETRKESRLAPRRQRIISEIS
jgi:hypothetical protein